MSALFWILVGAIGAELVGYGLVRLERSIPRCACDDSDCGGGCIDWENVP